MDRSDCGLSGAILVVALAAQSEQHLHNGLPDEFHVTSNPAWADMKTTTMLVNFARVQAGTIASWGSVVLLEVDRSRPLRNPLLESRPRVFYAQFFRYGVLLIC